jgi:hypothetical protein
LGEAELVGEEGLGAFGAGHLGPHIVSDTLSVYIGAHAVFIHYQQEVHLMFVTTIPGDMESATAALAAIGATVAAANAGAAPAQNAVVPSAPEPASVLFAAYLLGHGVLYQGTQAAGSAVHAMHVATLGTSAGSYAASEVANGLTML